MMPGQRHQSLPYTLRAQSRCRQDERQQGHRRSVTVVGEVECQLFSAQRNAGQPRLPRRSWRTSLRPRLDPGCDVGCRPGKEKVDGRCAAISFRQARRQGQEAKGVEALDRQRPVRLEPPALNPGQGNQLGETAVPRSRRLVERLSGRRRHPVLVKYAQRAIQIGRAHGLPPDLAAGGAQNGGTRHGDNGIRDDLKAVPERPAHIRHDLRGLLSGKCLLQSDDNNDPRFIGAAGRKGSGKAGLDPGIDVTRPEFQVLGIEILTAPIDDITDPAGDEQVPVIQETQIPRPKKAMSRIRRQVRAEPLGSSLILPIASGDMRSGDQDFADTPVG